MTQRHQMQTAHIIGAKTERNALRDMIADRQEAHKQVAGLQARLIEVTNEILKLENGNGTA